MQTVTILTTGGTIACSRTRQGLVPSLSGKELRAFIDRPDCQIEVRDLMQLDSTNIGPEEWTILAQEVYEALRISDGVLIVHGTDTMAYTAAALTRMLQNLRCPVVLTGAQRPLTEADSDGARNLRDAVTAALSDLTGVMIVFGGRVIRGDCARKVATACDDAFRSINVPQLGFIRDDLLTVVSWPVTPNEAPVILDTQLDTRVAAFVLYPGFDASLVRTALAQGCRGILLAAYGSGGVPSAQRDLLAVLEEARARGVRVVIATQCVSGAVDLERYEVGVRAQRLGCESAGKRTFEASLIHLMWELGHCNTLA